MFDTEHVAILGIELAKAMQEAKKYKELYHHCLNENIRLEQQLQALQSGSPSSDDEVSEF